MRKEEEGRQVHLADLCRSLNVSFTNSGLNLTKNSSSTGYQCSWGFSCLMKLKKMVEGNSDEPQDLNIPEIQFIDSGIIVAL